MNENEKILTDSDWEQAYKKNAVLSVEVHDNYFGAYGLVIKDDHVHDKFSFIMKFKLNGNEIISIINIERHELGQKIWRDRLNQSEETKIFLIKQLTDALSEEISKLVPRLLKDSQFLNLTNRQ